MPVAFRSRLLQGHSDWVYLLPLRLQTIRVDQVRSLARKQTLRHEPIHSDREQQTRGAGPRSRDLPYPPSLIAERASEQPWMKGMAHCLLACSVVVQTRPG